MNLWDLIGDRAIAAIWALLYLLVAWHVWQLMRSGRIDARLVLAMALLWPLTALVLLGNCVVYWHQTRRRKKEKE